MTEQRREHVRAPVALKVVYQRMNAFIADYTSNISKGGIFVETPDPFNPGTEFEFSVTIPGRSEGLRLKGRVTWVKKAKTEGMLGMGIAFIWDAEADRELFEGIVESIIVEKLGQAVYDKLAGS